MAMDERIGWLLLGCVIGYVIRLLQEIRKEVHEVDEIVTKNEKRKRRKRDRSEEGFARFPIVLDVLMICLFVLTGYSVVRVEQYVDAQEAQGKKLDQVSSCTLEFTEKTIKALNERTTYAADQLETNVEVLESQLEFLRLVLVLPPVTETRRRASLEEYVLNVDTYVDFADKAKVKTDVYPYPTNEDLQACLAGDPSKMKEIENDQRESGVE